MLPSIKQAVLLSTILLASCTQLMTRDQLPPRPPRDRIQSYSLEGRVSVKRGNESQQARMRWDHESGRDEIELSGPLGQKAARLIRDASGARMETSSRETQTASNWSDLAERILGVALPLDDMTSWVVANVAPAAIDARDPWGRPLSASVDGWRLEFREYESDSANALPTLIEARRDDIWVKLKIDQWNPGQIEQLH